MNIEINKIVDAGDLNKERVVMKVLVDDELGFYAAFKTKNNSPTTISANIKPLLWFPDKKVKKGDFIVLYTKVGVSTEKKNEDGTTSYFYYLDKADTLWNPENSFLLFKIDEWDYKSAS